MARARISEFESSHPGRRGLTTLRHDLNIAIMVPDKAWSRHETQSCRVMNAGRFSNDLIIVADATRAKALIHSREGPWLI
jgi:hypothetical protein